MQTSISLGFHDDFVEMLKTNVPEYLSDCHLQCYVVMLLINDDDDELTPACDVNENAYTEYHKCVLLLHHIPVTC